MLINNINVNQSTRLALIKKKHKTIYETHFGNKKCLLFLSRLAKSIDC